MMFKRQHMFSKAAVVETPSGIKVIGLQVRALMRDIGYRWETTTLAKYMFLHQTSYSFTVSNFFVLDMLYMLECLAEQPKIQTPKRILKMLIQELKTKTWLSKIETSASVVDMKKTVGLFPFPYKPYQTDFIEHYGRAIPAYKLKGYMLDAGPGTGKTVTNLALAEALEASKVVVISPKNAVDEVWRHTIDDLMKGNTSKAWVSSDRSEPTLDRKHYVVHYEYLENFLVFMEKNRRQFKNTVVILDESHFFNRLESQRTEFLIRMCQMAEVSYVNFASGTPIQAIGMECIPFLKCIDPFFTKKTEEAFRKIYGRSARKATEILRNRIGHLKYHVPSQDVVKVEVNETEIMVQIPNSDFYTLPAVSERISRYIMDRKAYYDSNMAKYESDYTEALAVFSKKSREATSSEYQTYLKYIREIRKGFDPRTMRDESMYCNKYESKVIMPALDPGMRVRFKNAKSVVKYVNLKIVGEALGNVLGTARTQCNMAMLAALDFETLINSAEKKTLIFTSYVDVVEATSEILNDLGYEPLLVYGETNKNLTSIVRNFYSNPDLNPMVATLQSLSTAVPITCANRIIFLNQPFRDATKLQAIARVARLGQDRPVDIFNVLLDTGDVPNLSTRSKDIMDWSREQVAAILGTTNLDLDTLSIENDLPEDVESDVSDVYISDDDLLGLTLYGTRDKWCSDLNAAILEDLRFRFGERIHYDTEDGTFYGTDIVPESLLHQTTRFHIIKPKGSDGWSFTEGSVPNVTYMVSKEPPSKDPEEYTSVNLSSIKMKHNL